MTPRLNLALLVLLIAVGIPLYWLLLDNRPGDVESFPLSITELRQIAASGEGEAPVAVSYERIAINPEMRNRLTAGLGLRYDFHPFYVFKVDYGDAAPVLIDTGMTQRQARQLDFARYDSAAASRIREQIGGARAIILLGRGIYHGGMLAPDLDPGQRVPDPNADEAVPFSPAQGIAVIGADQIRKDARIVFVRLANGREYLFAGAAAHTPQNWEEMRAPSRLDTDLLGTHDREASYRWYATIQNLTSQAPGLIIVPRRVLPKEHRMSAGFLSPDASAP